MLLYVGGLPYHLFVIFFCHLGGEKLEVAAAFSIDEFGGSGGIVEVNFMTVMEGVE